MVTNNYSGYFFVSKTVKTLDGLAEGKLNLLSSLLFIPIIPVFLVFSCYLLMVNLLTQMMVIQITLVNKKQHYENCLQLLHENFAST